MVSLSKVWRENGLISAAKKQQLMVDALALLRKQVEDKTQEGGPFEEEDEDGEDDDGIAPEDEDVTSTLGNSSSSSTSVAVTAPQSMEVTAPSCNLDVLESALPVVAICSTVVAITVVAVTGVVTAGIWSICTSFWTGKTRLVVGTIRSTSADVAVSGSSRNLLRFASRVVFAVPCRRSAVLLYIL